VAAPKDLSSVKLDWITFEAEKVIAKHARVSTKDPEREDYVKLLKYCLRENHVSIFEQASISFEIITSRAVSAQLIRHRSFHFQELSARYSDPSYVLDSYAEKCWQFELRAQDAKNRQNSLEYEDSDIEDQFRDRIKDLFDQNQKLYRDMLTAGVAKECARNLLWMCMPTRLHMSGTVRDWLFYVGVRSAPGTQKEHKYISDRIGCFMSSYLPTIALAVRELAEEDKNPGLKGWKHIDDFWKTVLI
jgi:thymidylate synthase (FAD)